MSQRINAFGAAALLLAATLMGVVRPSRASDIGTEFEKAIGPYVARSVQDASGVDDDPLLLPWIREIGAKVAAQSPRQDIKYTFRILRTDIDNAYTLPGGNIFVTRGLLDFVESDDELASVLAHESGHVAKRHAIQTITNGVVFLGLISAIQGRKYRALRTTAYAYNILRTFQKSREMEAQADEYGIRFAAGAGYDPNGLVHFFDDLGPERESRLESYFETHPSPQQRIADARKSELVTRPKPEERAAAANGYTLRGLPGEAAVALDGGDALALPPLPPLPPLPYYASADRAAIVSQADAIRKSLEPVWKARQTASRLQTILLINSQATDLRWLYVAAHAAATLEEADNLCARTERIAEVAPPTWDALARYGLLSAPGDPRATESALGREETSRALERAKGAHVPIGRAARALDIVFAELNDRFWRPGGVLGWARFLALEAALRYADSELDRAGHTSGQAWRLLSLARIRRYQARISELVPESDPVQRALWFDIAQRRFGAAFPTAGPAGDATVRGALAVELRASAMSLEKGRGDTGWSVWSMMRAGVPENIATAMRLLTLDLERETADRNAYKRP